MSIFSRFLFSRKRRRVDCVFSFSASAISRLSLRPRSKAQGGGGERRPLEAPAMRATGVFAEEEEERGGGGEQENAFISVTPLAPPPRPLPPLLPPPPLPPLPLPPSLSSSSSSSLPDPSNLRPLPRDLPSWGVPPLVSQAYASRCSVSLLHEWQAAALREAVSGNGFIFAAPTSGGKSLVAEVLLVRQLLRAREQAENEAARGSKRRGNFSQAAPARRVRAVVALPYSALVAEKAHHLAAVLGPAGISVKGYWAGSNNAEASDGSGNSRNPVGVGGRGTPFNASSPQNSPVALLGEDVAVLTPEKLNGCFSALSSNGRLGEICCVVIDGE